jgi:hypothetical protein
MVLTSSIYSGAVGWYMTDVSFVILGAASDLKPCTVKLYEAMPNRVIIPDLLSLQST